MTIYQTAPKHTYVHWTVRRLCIILKRKENGRCYSIVSAACRADEASWHAVAKPRALVRYAVLIKCHSSSLIYSAQSTVNSHMTLTVNWYRPLHRVSLWQSSYSAVELKAHATWRRLRRPASVTSSTRQTGQTVQGTDGDSVELKLTAVPMF